MAEQINAGAPAEDNAAPQRLIEIGAEEMWTPFLEKINDIFILEKKARHDGDNAKLTELCKEVVQLAFDEKDYVHMREWLIVLTKRRGQAKKAIIDMVGLAQNTLLEQLPSREEKMNLLATLREACDGKMFLEREYSQCTRQVVEMHEADGKIDEATKIIQEIQIETYGTLENKEKVDFILYQMKLVLLRQDFVRCQILSRKISKKAISEVGLEAQKIQYFSNMVQYHVYEKELLNAAKDFQIIFDVYNKADAELTAKLDSTGEKKSLAFRNFVLYLLVSPYDNEKVDMLNIVEKTYPRDLEKEELISKFVRKFLTFELMPLHEDQVEQQMLAFEPFSESTRNHKKHLSEMIRQLVQHNIRVIEKYYSRIGLERLSQLVGVSVERAENEIGDMVVNKRILAKINRLAGVVVFQQRHKFTNETLDTWNHDIKTVLDKIEQTCHLINREKVIHS